MRANVETTTAVPGANVAACPVSVADPAPEGLTVPAVKEADSPVIAICDEIAAEPVELLADWPVSVS